MDVFHVCINNSNFTSSSVLLRIEFPRTGERGGWKGYYSTVTIVIITRCCWLGGDAVLAYSLAAVELPSPLRSPVHCWVVLLFAVSCASMRMKTRLSFRWSATGLYLYSLTFVSLVCLSVCLSAIATSVLLHALHPLCENILNEACCIDSCACSIFL